MQLAKNDAVLIDGIIQQRISDGVAFGDKGEAFEYFTFEQILKNYDLTQDEIDAGWVDGRSDGGIDGFFMFVNGHLVSETNNFYWPKTKAQFDIFVITCKHHDTFKEATLNTLVASVHELFDLSLEKLSGSYSDEILAQRQKFGDVYKRLAMTDPDINFHFIYASRGDSTTVGESVLARGQQITNTISAFFSNSNASFTFFGAAELVARFRESKQFSLELISQDYLTGNGDGYICVVRLGDYYDFISDEHGDLRRYLFDSNVRDYLGDNKVNDDIAASLEDESIADFWWLNNGITILATKAVINGRTFILQDIQVVNGLQTTETIHRHFSTGTETSKNRTLAIKIVASNNESLRDQIIRATNNQSAVEQAALHATDKIQRDIEQILEKYDWYYERRKNYYRNIGRPLARFVTPMYLATGFVALGLKDPVRAAQLRPKFMRNKHSYETVFSEAVPIEVWPAIAAILKACEDHMSESTRQRGGNGERLLRSWRGVVALLFVARTLGHFNYSLTDIIKIELDQNAKNIITQCWNSVQDHRKGARQPSPSIIADICFEFTEQYKLAGKEVVGKSNLKLTGPVFTRKVTPEFLDQVDMLLPDQPWPTGVHLDIATKLDVSANKVSAAITKLIDLGRRLDQIDGKIITA